MRRLLVPLVVVALAVGLNRWWARDSLSSALLISVSRGIFAVAFVLAWRFQRGRIGAAVLLLAAAAEALRFELPEDADRLRSALEPAVAFLLPLNLALFAHLREWRVLSVDGAIRFAGLVVEVGAVGFLLRGATLDEWLQAPLVAGEVRVGTLPQPAGLSFLVAAILLLIALGRRRGALEAGLLGALLAAFVACAWPGAGASHPTYYLTAGGLVLALSLVENAFALAFEDGLTGLPARRALEETLLQLPRRYAIAMIDVDHFKKLNDRHGHEVGDQVLRLIGSRLAAVGGGGRAFRYGGEEFTVVFAGRTATEAEPVLDELRRTIADHRFSVRAPGRPPGKPSAGRGRGATGKLLKVTVSIGLAERGSRRRPEQVLKAADKALYRAKRGGRNRLTVAR